MEYVLRKHKFIMKEIENLFIIVQIFMRFYTNMIMIN